MKNHDEKYSSSSSSMREESTVSNGSSSISSSDMTYDASSSPSPSLSCSANSSRALYDMSEIMEQLPIKDVYRKISIKLLFIHHEYWKQFDRKKLKRSVFNWDFMRFFWILGYSIGMILNQLKSRGLSKFYQGKSESFTSLSRVGSIEDLAKKATPSTLLPKAIIGKRTTMCSSFSSRGGTFKNSNPH
ncbi:hypothetical protein OROMI_004383 [Orobanche minor]